MSIMSKLHQEASDNKGYLESIHNILLGQRKVAQGRIDSLSLMGSRNPENYRDFNTRIACINDLLLEFEAAGVVWPSVTTDGRKPDNVVELNAPCKCEGDIHPEHGPWG